MANFKSILSGIGKVLTTVLGVERVAEPLLHLIPGVGQAVTVFDNFTSKILNGIGSLEVDQLDGQGNIKAQAIVDDFEAGLSIAKQLAALRGETVTYDEPELRAAISDIVSGLNRLAKVKGSIKSVPIPKK